MRRGDIGMWEGGDGDELCPNTTGLTLLGKQDGNSLHRAVAATEIPKEEKFNHTLLNNGRT